MPYMPTLGWLHVLPQTSLVLQGEHVDVCSRLETHIASQSIVWNSIPDPDTANTNCLLPALVWRETNTLSLVETQNNRLGTW